MKLEDIARLANVSISSVSLALNNRPGISDKTREKILAIVKENNYVPPKNSKLNTRDVRVLVVPERDANQTIYYNMFNSLSMLGKSSKIVYTLQFIDQESLDCAIGGILANQNNDALLLIASELPRPVLDQLEQSGQPIMLINYPEFTSSLTEISVDYYYAGYCAARFATEASHHLGLICSDTTSLAVDRINEGVSAYFREIGAKAHLPIELKKSPIATEDYITDFLRLQEMGRLPNCILCDTDVQAINVIRTAAMMKLKVPADLSVIALESFSDNRNILPTLTRVSVPLEYFSQQIERLLLQMFSAEYQPLRVLLPPKIELGESYHVKVPEK